jgi:putative transcriptional regulator
MTQNIKIYNRIQLFRTAHKLSREDLAKSLGINFQTIGYLERGEYNPSLELSLKMAQFFGVKVEDLFSLTEFETFFPKI